MLPTHTYPGMWDHGVQATDEWIVTCAEFLREC